MAIPDVKNLQKSLKNTTFMLQMSIWNEKLHKKISYCRLTL